MKLRVGSSSWRKSKIIQKTLNPDWNETFVLPVGDPQKDCLEIRVFDHDILVDDALGEWSEKITTNLSIYFFFPKNQVKQ